MEAEKQNLQLSDRLLAKTLLPFFPIFVKPNHLTIFRLILTFPTVYFLWSGCYVTGGILFVLAAITDALDGALARVRGQVTDWGRIYDPLVDKILICSVVYILVRRYVDVYAAWLIVILETVIIVAAFIRKRDGAILESNALGKTKMVLQVLGVLLLLFTLIFNWEMLLPVTRGTFYLAVAFAVLSLFSYSI